MLLNCTTTKIRTFEMIFVDLSLTGVPLPDPEPSSSEEF